MTFHACIRHFFSTIRCLLPPPPAAHAPQQAKQEDVQRVAAEVASLRQQVSGLQELLERMHVKMAYASKKRA